MFSISGGVGFELRGCFLGQSTVVVSEDKKQSTVKVAKGNGNLTRLSVLTDQEFCSKFSHFP